MNDWLTSGRLLLLLRRTVAGLVFVSMLLGGVGAPGLAAQQEPSPVAVDLVVPEEAGPGSVIEVLIHFDAVDLNADTNLRWDSLIRTHFT